MTEHDPSQPHDPRPRPESGEKGLRPLIDRRWIILAGLFGVTLFLGLPVLWMSRVFSRTEKVVITILTLVWTLIVFAAFCGVMWWCYTRIHDALAS